MKEIIKGTLIGLTILVMTLIFMCYTLLNVYIGFIIWLSGQA